MKFVKHFLLTLVSAAFVFGFTGCDKQQGTEQPEDKTPGRASDLLTLFYQTVEQQNGVNPREKVYIVAHRANTQKAINAGVPENSLEIIQMAIESGVVDMIEIDVRPTKDGVLVLMHDETINRTTNGTGKVSNLTYEQLMKYDMKRDTRPSNGIKVPTLKQVFELCKDKMFINLDIHSKNVPIGDLANLIIECGMMDQVMIYSSQAELFEYPTIDPNFILHPYVSNVGAAGNYKSYFGAKLFQYGLDYSEKKSNINFAKEMRAAGFLTYTNILDHDNKLRSGDFVPLLTFIESETDFIQTDVAEIVHEFLEVEGLR